MKQITIEIEDNVPLDLQTMHRMLYTWLNPIGCAGTVVQISSPNTINVYQEKEFSDISIMGPVYDALVKEAKKAGKTPEQFLKDAIR